MREHPVIKHNVILLHKYPVCNTNRVLHSLSFRLKKNIFKRFGIILLLLTFKVFLLPFHKYFKIFD